MDNIQEELDRLVNSEHARVLTGVSKEGDMMALMTMMSMTQNNSITDRIFSEKNPMRAFSSVNFFVVGDTERIKTDSEYYEKFIELCRQSELDRDFAITFLGESLTQSQTRKH